MCILKWFVAFVVYYKINCGLCSLDKISDMGIVSTLSLHGFREATYSTSWKASEKYAGQKERACVSWRYPLDRLRKCFQIGTSDTRSAPRELQTDAQN